MPPPLLSLVVTTFKRPKALQRALSSLVFSPWLEVLVVDDDINQSGLSVCQEFNAVRYFSKRFEDSGVSSSRNIGIRNSSGKYLCFLDDDDFFLPDGLQLLKEATASGKSFYYSNYEERHKDRVLSRSLAKVADRRLLVINEIPIGSYLIARSSLKSHFDVTMRSHEDWDFLLRNVEWSDQEFVPVKSVAIDKIREYPGGSILERRRPYLWMDFIGIYSRFPAPDFIDERVSVLKRMGLNLPREIFKGAENF